MTRTATTLGMATLVVTFFAAAEAQAWGPFGSSKNAGPLATAQAEERPGLVHDGIVQLRTIRSDLRTFLRGVRGEIQAVKADLRTLWQSGDRSPAARRAAREQVRELRHAAKQARADARAERRAILPGKRVGQKRVGAADGGDADPGRRLARGHDGNARAPEAAAHAHGREGRAAATAPRPNPRAERGAADAPGRARAALVRESRGQGPAHGRLLDRRPAPRRHINDGR